METIEPLLREEVADVWRLWKAGVVLENSARADDPGVVIVFQESQCDADALARAAPAPDHRWFHDEHT
jgi:hypothetical protein